MAYARVWVVEKAAEKAAGVCPCRECKDRVSGCHSSCQKGYREWTQRVREIRTQMLAQERGERETTAYQRESFDRAVKKHEITETKWGTRTKRSRYT